MFYFIDMNYVEVLKDFMIENGLTQQKLADILGVNQTPVSQWLLGKKKPGYDSIMAIYNKFGIMPNTLFGINE